MRVWISGAKTYIDPVNPNDVMPGQGIARVLSSKSKKFKENDLVLGLFTWQKFLIIKDK